MKRTGIISMLLVILLLLSTSCASGISQEEYDSVKNELNAIKSELAALQGQLAESEALQAQNEELSNKHNTVKGEYEAVQAEYDKLSDNYDSLQSEYEAMQDKYDELSADYDALSEQGEVIEEEEEVVEIAEEDVEMAILDLINQDRLDNGLDEFIWGPNLHKHAKKNSEYMATNKILQLSDYTPSWQEVYWATGYGTEKEIAEATWLVWKNRENYDRNFHYEHFDYGAIGVHKSGDIFYISYISSQFR